MLVAYSLICMSLWSGALNYHCEQSADWIPPPPQGEGAISLTCSVLFLAFRCFYLDFP